MKNFGEYSIKKVTFKERVFRKAQYLINVFLEIKNSRNEIFNKTMIRNFISYFVHYSKSTLKNSQIVNRNRLIYKLKEKNQATEKKCRN